MQNLDIKILEEYKMKLFNELIRLVWEDNLEEVDNIPKKILGDNIYQDFDKQTIVNLMRIIMGLNPLENVDKTIKDTVYEALNIDEVSQPIISIVSQACKYCNREDKEQECFIKNKHINCNKKDTCSSCGECISKCNLGAISDKIQFIPMINLLKKNSTSVYAMVAPAFVGQFGKDITPAKLRTALKSIGFEDMIEVALAADILTVKEAFEYCDHMKDNDEEYFITSCCCPVWVSLIKTNFPEILKNVSPSVSPMIACARTIKILNPQSKVVFIGPCTAKKKEATLEDVKGDVDFVLTFKELQEIFNALKINLSQQKEEERTESSYCGRIYAKTGGVSEAIKISAQKIDKDIRFESIAFNGINECREGIQKIINKELKATFIEGMGCIGGCVGGPKRILNVDDGTKYVQEYGEETEVKTPFENINVIQFLTAMGIKKIESLGDKEEDKIVKIFSRSIEDSK